MNFSIEIEDHEIVSTGTIIGLVDKKIIFKIEDLTFELEFKNNNEVTENKISSQVPEEGKTMKLLFENFNNSLGVGNAEPFKMGFVGDKTLLLIYRVYALTENSGKLFHYTWLLEKGGENA